MSLDRDSIQYWQFEEEADQILASFDTLPGSEMSGDDTYGSTLRRVIDYCSMPHLAGKQVYEFIGQLPGSPPDLQNAFVRLGILFETRRLLVDMRAENDHLHRIISGESADECLKRFKKKQKDRQESEPKPSDVERDLENEIQLIVYEEVYDKDHDDLIARQARSDDLPEGVPDFSNKSDTTAFRAAIVWLTDEIIEYCKGNLRVLFNSKIISIQEIGTIIAQIKRLRDTLPPPGSGGWSDPAVSV